MDEKRVADYFVLTGLPDQDRIVLDDAASRDGTSSPLPLSSQGSLDPITDIAVIVRSQGEVVPKGWHCIESTPLQYQADLNHGSLRSPSIFICFRRGRDKPPLVDVGVLYEGKERVMADSEVVHTTPYGRPANVNNSGSRTFLTYRRAKDNAPCNQLVVTDICIILTSKGETPPHAFCLVHKNLNKGMVGSDVYLCYKKSMNRPPLLRYQSSILGRFPLDDYDCYALPESVPMFCMPMGATIEVWQRQCQQPRPVFSTFVLTSESAVKVYGAAVTFYEKYPESKLTEEERLQLGMPDKLGSDHLQQDISNYSFHAAKSICILSRWSFFDTFEKFLMFLYRSLSTSGLNALTLPIERYISHFMVEVPFPSVQRPKILVQLTSTSDETVLLSQPPEDMPLPLSGASFTQLLRNLGPDNCMNVLLLTLLEQKILLHSLRPDVLTGVAEALTSLIFPFHWQCPYIPLCPLGLCDVLNAPLPFIVGVDSRYFDFHEPPFDVVCVDLDTNSIYLSENKRSLHVKALPKRPTRILKNTLDHLFEKLVKPSHQSGNGTAYNSQTVKSRVSSSPFSTETIAAKKFERQIDLEIQEAFLFFMASIMRNFRSYLLPITKAPTVGATDPGSLFDQNGFLKSRDKNYHRFYQLLMTTQMFVRFIEERSFVSDKDTCLAFFDECLDKIEAVSESDSYVNLRLLDTDDYLKNDRTVFIPAPESNEGDTSTYTYHSFGPLEKDLFHVHPDTKSQRNNHDESGLSVSPSRSQLTFSATPGSPLSRRTKQEVRAALRVARRHSELPLTWAKCLVSYCYSLWFIQLPAYVKASQSSSSSKNTPLRTAIEMLQRMQSISLHPLDEVCYRVLMLLCGEYGQPVLAVKVLFEMKQNGVIPNAITYGYYNKAVLESKWPAGDTTAALLWSRLRNVVAASSEFKKCGRRSSERLASSPIKTLTSEENAVLVDLSEAATNTELDKLVANDRVAEDKVENSLIPSTANEFKVPKVDGINFKASNAFRKRTGSIVKASPSTIGLAHIVDSSAGVLMTTSLNPKSALSLSLSLSENQFSGMRQSHHQPLSGKKSLSPTAELPQSKPYVRSYSFGNDARIINKLQEGPLKALKHELERNHQVVEENVLVDEENIKQSDISGCVTPGVLSKLDECVENDSIEMSADSTDNLAASSSEVGSAKTVSSSQPSTKENIKKLQKPTNFRQKVHSFDCIDSREENLSPTTRQANSGLFSPESKLANTFRASFRLASRFASSPQPKSSMSRSLTFNEHSDKLGSKITSLFRSKNLKDNDSFDSGHERSPLNRSATLPSSMETRDRTSSCHSVDDYLKKSDTDSATTSNSGGVVPSQESLAEDGESGLNGGSPWASRIAASKHFDFMNTTIKSAANTMASRINEIKSTLTSSNTNSPSKSANSSMIGGTAAFLNQWANMITEKIPSQFALDDDDFGSSNSLDARRLSMAASEDDLSERSREGSVTKNTGHHHQPLHVFPNSLFEVLENHYSMTLDHGRASAKLLYVEMTSSCRCYTCAAILFDEEIMEGWSADDSNLNTICPYCSSSFVPLLSVTLKNKRTSNGESIAKADGKIEVGANPVDDPLGVNTKRNQPKKMLVGLLDFEPFTVPYLSPLVLRKEIETVLLHEGDLTLLNAGFVDEHPIIYYNLLWYFKRINVPTHLPGLLFKSKNQSAALDGIVDLDKADHRNVSVTCLWDNYKLHEDIRKPMYRVWSESNLQSSLLHALAAEDRSVSLNTIKQIINAVQCNDLITPMNLLTNERCKLSNKPDVQKNCYSVYRDLLFLTVVAIGRENIDEVSFDREYRRAYESICPRQQLLLSAVDRPPSLAAIFCRRFFKELELKPVY